MSQSNFHVKIWAQPSCKLAQQISGTREAKAAEQPWSMLTILHLNTDNIAERGLGKPKLNHTDTHHVGLNQFPACNKWKAWITTGFL